MRYAKRKQAIGDLLVVEWSDGASTYFNAFALGCKWFLMSNDDFYALYGFSWTPHEIRGLYERCRAKVYSGRDL